MQSPTTFPFSSDEAAKRAHVASFLPPSEWTPQSGTQVEEKNPAENRGVGGRPRSQRADVTRVAYLCYPAAAAVASDARINCKKASKRGGVFARVRRAAQKWISLTQRSVVLQVALRWTGGTRAFGRRESVSENIHSHSAALSECVVLEINISSPQWASRLACSTYPVLLARLRASQRRKKLATANIVIEQASHSLLAIRLVGAFLSRAYTHRGSFLVRCRNCDHKTRSVFVRISFSFFLSGVFSFNFAPSRRKSFLDLLESFSHSFDSENRLLAIEDLMMPLWEGLFSLEIKFFCWCSECCKGNFISSEASCL